MIFFPQNEIEACEYQFSLQVWCCNRIGCGPEMVCLFFRICFPRSEWVSENRPSILKGYEGVRSSFLQGKGNSGKIRARDHHPKACQDNVGNNSEG